MFAINSTIKPLQRSPRFPLILLAAPRMPSFDHAQPHSCSLSLEIQPDFSLLVARSSFSEKGEKNSSKRRTLNFSAKQRESRNSTRINRRVDSIFLQLSTRRIYLRIEVQTLSLISPWARNRAHCARAINCRSTRKCDGYVTWKRVCGVTHVR